MFCSYCGIQLPEGRRVCDQCGPQQVAPVEPVTAPGVHPACHVIAGLVGIGVVMGLLGLCRIAMFFWTQPKAAQTMRFSFLFFPVSPQVHLMITMALMVTTVVCVIGLYAGRLQAWAVLLGLRALFLPFILSGLISYLNYSMRNYGSMAYGSDWWFLLNFLIGFSGPLLDVAVVVLLLKYKRRLVR